MFKAFNKIFKPVYKNSDEFLQKNKAFCMMPWVHFHSTQEGNVTPCCQAKWDKDLSFGNINEQSIQEIWGGKKMNDFRKGMMNGRKDIRCSKCYEKEEDGWTSLRNITNKKYASDIIKVANGNTEEFSKPVYFDIRFSNKCNLRCRICGPWSSSNWTHDYALLQGNKYQDAHITYGVKDDKKFMDEFTQLIPLLKEMYFAGGEPLMIDANYEMLDLLIRNNKTQVELFYNTNLTVLDYKGRSITELWKHFTKVTVAASIDDYGAHFEYHRKNANWEEVKNNIHTLKKECPLVRLIFSPTISLFNICRLSEFHKTVVSDGLVSVFDFIPTLLVQPDECNIQSLPIDLKAVVRKKLTEHMEWLRSRRSTPDEMSDYVIDQYKNIITYMEAKNGEQWSVFLLKQKKLDSIRLEDFESVFSEYKNYLIHAE